MEIQGEDGGGNATVHRCHRLLWVPVDFLGGEPITGGERDEIQQKDYGKSDDVDTRNTHSPSKSDDVDTRNTDFEGGKMDFLNFHFDFPPL